MSEEAPPGLDQGERGRPGESLLQRLHRRKLEARQRDRQMEVAVATPAEAPAPPELTDADMPPLESLTIDSDYSGFLSAKVSESLRRAALRRLFHSQELNVLDGLDDYAEDFTRFAGLGELVTAEMRHRFEVEAQRQAEALRQALLEDPGATAQAPPGGPATTRAAPDGDDPESPDPAPEDT